MRASCPNVADGTEFQVVNAATKAVVRTGTVEKGIADFTGLTADTDTTFVKWYPILLCHLEKGYG